MSYQATQQKLSDRIALLEQGLPLEGIYPSPGERLVRLFACRFQALSLAGDLPGCAALDREIATKIEDGSLHHDLWLLRASIAVKLHRLRDAEAILAKDMLIATSPQGRLLRIDLDVQYGHYDAAREALRQVIDDDPAWDAFARLAYLTGLSGDIAAADRLYEAAEDELTAKQMHLFAWLETQRGFLRFERGQYAAAEQRYTEADTALPGYWLVQQRLSELRGAQGKGEEAIANYTALYATAPRGEWAQAIGDLYALNGDMAQAYEWRMRAFDDYLQATAAGEIYPCHMLVDLCCELPGRTGEAVHWAQTDAAIRRNHATLGDLAWAFYRDGKGAAASETIEQALAFGVESARLFVQAACIYAATGRGSEGAEWMRRARAINPAPAPARFGKQHVRITFASATPSM